MVDRRRNARRMLAAHASTMAGAMVGRVTPQRTTVITLPTAHAPSAGTATTSVDVSDVIVRRVIAHVVSHEPNIGGYHRAHRAGSSRRRGRAASQHWAIERLRHLTGWFPDVSVLSLRLAGTELLSGETSADVFHPNVALDIGAFPPTPIIVAEGRSDIEFEIRSRDMRRASVVISLIVSPLDL